MSDGECDFGRLYAEYQPRTRRDLVGLVNEQEAKDLTQAVFLKVSQVSKDFRGGSMLVTWIHRFATNTATGITRPGRPPSTWGEGMVRSPINSTGMLEGQTLRERSL